MLCSQVCAVGDCDAEFGDPDEFGAAVEELDAAVLRRASRERIRIR